MATPEFKYVESLLEEYMQYPKYLNQRREELYYPLSNDDNNIGGSNPNFNTTAPQESFLIRVSQDKRLKRLEDQYMAMTLVLNRLSKDDYTIIESYYFKKPRTLTWDGVAHKAHCSRRHALNVRDRVVIEIGRELGVMD